MVREMDIGGEMEKELDLEKEVGIGMDMDMEVRMDVGGKVNLGGELIMGMVMNWSMEVYGNMKQYKETKYYITKTGEVWSKKFGKLRKLNPVVTKRGYHMVNICSDGISKSMGVHRLVGECYIPNPYNKPEINHIDGDKTNNHYTNLEWCTRKENIHHRDNVMGKHSMGEQNGRSKLTEDDVKWIRENYVYRSSEFGTTALGRKFGVSHGQIHQIIKNKQWVKN